MTKIKMTSKGKLTENTVHCSVRRAGLGRKGVVGSKAIVGKPKKEVKFGYRGDGR